MIAVSTDRKLALDPYKHHVDWYDHMFDRRAAGVPIWKRNTRDDFPPRREQFKRLMTYSEVHPQFRAAFNVPAHGVKGEEWIPARWLHGGKRYGLGPFQSLDDETEVVAYLDETMHQGLGKERMPFKDVPDGVFWSHYMPTEDGKGHSRRWLNIGDKWLALLEYRSEDWRSNFQTTDIDLRFVALNDASVARDSMFNWMRSQMIELKSPLFAVDGTLSQGEWWATDVNLAPGFEACIRDRLTPTQVVSAIKKFYFEHCAP